VTNLLYFALCILHYDVLYSKHVEDDNVYYSTNLRLHQFGHNNQKQIKTQI